MTNLEYEMLVKTRLREKKLTASHLADKLGISSPYLSDILRGNRQANDIRKKINETLNIKLPE